MTMINLGPNIEIFEIPVHTDEWYDFRSRGIGSSETGYIMGLSPYKSSIEVWHEKVGILEPWRGMSQAAFHGTQLEGYVADIWKYWDGKEDGYVENYNNGKQIRSCEYYAVKDKYFVNKKYPWLFTSLDALILPGNANLLTGEPLKKYGSLECKLISGFVLKQWEGGVPPQYLAQIHVQMIVLELDYAELAMLSDGKNFSVDSIPMVESFKDAILEQSKAFWYDRVIPARELKKKMREAEGEGRYDLSIEYEAKVQQLEPEPDESEAYKNFMAKNALLDPVTMKGGMDQYDWLENMKNLHAMEKRCHGKKTLYENKIRKFMRDENVDKLDFSDLGYCNLSERKGSDKLVLGNRIDYKAADEYINAEFNKMDLIAQ